MTAPSEAGAKSERGVRLDTYLFFLLSFTLVVFLTHAPYFGLPYFWDELGQFVPAALDIYHDGAWIPHSTVPNAHPPGVMAYLAAVWNLFGYSIPATRAAMLLLGSCASFFTFLLAIHLCRGLRGAPAFAPALLLLIDPLFYTQAMMAQLDMPAMLFTVLALLLFLQDRHPAAALACTALVLSKETGALLPLILVLVLLADPPRTKFAVYYIAPFAVLAVWFFVLWRATGHLFGDAGFTHYNLGYALNPVRASLCLLRRIYYLFLADFRWVGTVAIALAWKKDDLLHSRLADHLAVHRGSRADGQCAGRRGAGALPSSGVAAGLHRYGRGMVPATADVAQRKYRGGRGRTHCRGRVESPVSIPVRKQSGNGRFRGAAADCGAVPREDLSYSPNLYCLATYPSSTLSAFGYVNTKQSPAEMGDLRYSTLRALEPNDVDVLVLYSRTWEPDWGVLRFGAVERFLQRFYEYEPQMNTAQVREHFGLIPIQRWTRRGQWVEIYSRAPI